MKKIFLFIDHSDIQDEAQFYREDKYGNIVRKWMSDTEVKSKNRKYKIKNYLKQTHLYSNYMKTYQHQLFQMIQRNVLKVKMI